MFKHDLKLDNVFFEDSLDVSSQLINRSHLRYLNKGKHIRAQLLTKLGNVLDIEDSYLSVLSRVVEMTHNATLVHDDVIDNSLYRRKSNTLNAVYDNKTTVLFGDYILARAMYELSVLERPRLISQMALALKRLVDGELTQLNAKNPFDFSLEDYDRLAKNKTGALFSWALSSIIELGVSESLINFDLIDNIGLEFGKLFQVRDDILDFSTDSKTCGLDIQNNNINYILTLLNEELSPVQKESILSAQSIDHLETEIKTMLYSFVHEQEKAFDHCLESFLEDHIFALDLGVSALKKRKFINIFVDVIEIMKLT